MIPPEAIVGYTTLDETLVFLLIIPILNVKGGQYLFLLVTVYLNVNFPSLAGWKESIVCNQNK